MGSHRMYDQIISSLRALDIDAMVKDDDGMEYVLVLSAGRDVRVFHPRYSDLRRWEVLVGSNDLHSCGASNGAQAAVETVARLV